MIARGFILLGFRPPGMRTRHGSLREDDALLAFEKVRVRKNYRPCRAYHLIFYFLSEDVRAQMKPRRARLALL
jgi:hypothetical protein